MKHISFGCQTYSWQMSYNRYADKLSEIAHVIKSSGFSGIEAELCMMGKYFDDWAEYARLLRETGLSYSALALPLEWRHSEETPEEYDIAQKAIAFLKHFPGTLLLLCHLPGKDRSELKERQNNQIQCITSIARRASFEGITTAFHPNSSYGSAFRTEEDYHFLLERIGSTELGFCPDAGHIAHGEMDPVKLIREYHSLVRHVHFKDMKPDGTWTAMVKGCIDFPAIVRDLRDFGYNGWIMVEEESDEAKQDPDCVTHKNGTYFANHLLPLIKEE